MRIRSGLGFQGTDRSSRPLRAGRSDVSGRSATIVSANGGGMSLPLTLPSCVGSAPALISLKPQVKVLFASGSDDLIPSALEHLNALYPELPTEVVSEFPPPEGRWTRYHVNRSFLQFFHGEDRLIAARRGGRASK